MKKAFITLLIIMTGVCAQAQLRTSRTFVHQKSKMEWTVRAGVSFDRLTGYVEGDLRGMGDPDVGGKTGFAVDFGFNKFFKNSNLYWGMELGIDTRGTSFSKKDDKYDMEMSGLFYNLKWSPFTIGYKVPVMDNIKVDPHIGLFASYDFATSANEYNGDKIDYTENKLDAGLQFGVGVWYGRFNLDLMYQVGFVPANVYYYRNYYADCRYIDGGKTSNFLIRLGISF